MGDNLAQLLYTTFVNASSNVAGGDVPNWASLPAVDREQWEQVAVKARREMSERFVASIDSATSAIAMSSSDPLLAVRARWAR